MAKKTRLDIILAHYPEEEFLKVDGFDEAIIGIQMSDMRLIYSVSLCIDKLLKDFSIPPGHVLSLDEALDYFEYNVRGAYMGEKTPIWCEDYFIH